MPSLTRNQWQCGDSFFTKSSSCSFDRAVHDQAGLLNPLHPSITPYGLDNDKPRDSNGTAEATSGATSPAVPTGPKLGGNGRIKRRAKREPKSGININITTNTSRHLATPGGTTPSTRLSVIDLSRPGSTVRTTTSTGREVEYPRDRTTGQTIPIALAEIGKASRFGDRSLGGEGSKCHVFEVVQQTRETSACPACARSARRARLPAHARGCYGLS